MMNYTYIPPQELNQLSTLLALLSDPDKTNKLWAH